jgi:FMN phosphatase YigB (HAD superfamily)
MPAIQGVLLDADGVIQLPGAGWRAAVAALCEDPIRTDEFCAEIFAAEKPCLTGAEDFAVALGQVLGRWQSRASVEVALRVWAQIVPATEVIAMVQRLRRSCVIVALATNQQAYRAEYMTSSLGYARYFDHLLYSCEIGYSKPSIEYFSAATQELELSRPGHFLSMTMRQTSPPPEIAASMRRCFTFPTAWHDFRRFLRSMDLPSANSRAMSCECPVPA